MTFFQGLILFALGVALSLNGLSVFTAGYWVIALLIFILLVALKQDI
jgi:hypothetical protein